MPDLSNTSVFLDFDGTITVTDVGLHLLERLAGPGWIGLDDQYAAGALGSRDCIERQWQCIPNSVTEAQRRAVASEVPLDPGYGDLIDGLRARGAEVAVVSDGWGFYIPAAIEAWCVPVFSNNIDFATNTLLSPYSDPLCATCGACGTCKPKIVREASERGRATIFIGDGTSDRHAARVADTVFAKGALARWCAAEAISHFDFNELREVAAALLS